LDADAELRLTIMSSIAQEESRKTSERVKWGQKRRMEQGIVFGRSMLGYDVKDGKMIINEEGAKIVRLIFDKFVNEGKGTHVIARELREDGIVTHTNMQKWSNTVILRIIRNEKYCGDLVQKKTYTPDYLSHEKKYNRGEEEFVIIEDHHEPIVSKEIFERAKAILDSRAVSQERKAKHSNRYAFSGKIKCGICGASYVSRYKARKDGSQYKAWRCYEGTKYGRPHIDKSGNKVGCLGKGLNNQDALHIMGMVCNALDMNKEIIVSNMIRIIKSVISAGSGMSGTETLETKAQQIEGKRTRLIELYLSEDISKEEFLCARTKCEVEAAEIQDLIENVKKEGMLKKQQQSMIQDITNTLNEIVSGMAHDDTYYRNLLDKMVVHDRGHIDVYLNLLPFQWRYAVGKTRCISDTDIGSEELGHMEMIATFVYKLTEGVSAADMKAAGLDSYYADHRHALFWQNGDGVPWVAAYISATGDPVADLTENMAAEQKARAIYENLIDLTDDYWVKHGLKWLREREIVHFQRFGEALVYVEDHLAQKHLFPAS
jgi:hypothetical protein